MAVFNNNLLAGAGAQSSASTYKIDQSLRFDSSANVNLIDSSVGAGDSRKKNTFSVWVKRGKITSQGYIGAYRYDATNYQYWLFKADDTLEFTDVSGGSVIGKLVTTQVFRDVSAWYNLTFVWDTANVIPTERMIIYVNGQRVTSLSTATYPSLNVDSGGAGRASSDIRIGTYYAVAGTFFDGYMANIVYIDNGALDASSFGETNDNGIWIPRDVSGLTFGTRGFYIDGRDASDLGDDESGNGNDFSSGLSADDQMADSPTNNHATWNPLTGSAQVYSNGNLNAATASAAWKGGLTTIQVPLNSGTWYYEVYIDSAGSSSGQFSVGWSESNRSMSDDNSSGDTEGWITYAINGNYYARSGAGSYGASYTTGDVIGCKVNTNTSTNNVEWYKNGASQGTRSEPLNLGGTGFISPYILLYGTRNGTARFAQNEWTQTPSGITEANAINTTNLGAE